LLELTIAPFFLHRSTLRCHIVLTSSNARAYKSSAISSSVSHMRDAWPALMRSMSIAVATRSTLRADAVDHPPGNRGD